MKDSRSHLASLGWLVLHLVSTPALAQTPEESSSSPSTPPSSTPVDQAPTDAAPPGASPPSPPNAAEPAIASPTPATSPNQTSPNQTAPNQTTANPDPDKSATPNSTPPSATPPNPTPPSATPPNPTPPNPTTSTVVADAVDGVQVDPVQLDPLSIVAPAIDLSLVGGSAQYVGQKELETYEHDDVQRILNRVPGVYTRSEDGYGLRPNIGMRGVSSDRSSKVTLMEDGILLGPAPYSAPAAYYFPMTTRLVGLEVFKGPAAIRYGPQTVGGAINLLTRPIPTTMQGQIDLAGGLYRYGKGHGWWGMSGKRWGILLEGAHLQSNGFQNIDGAADGGNTGFQKNELMAKLQYRTAATASVYQLVEAKFGYSDEVSHQSYLGLSAADFAQDAYRRYASTQNDRMDWRRFQAQLSHLLSWGERLELRTTLYRHDFTRTWRRLDRFRSGSALKDVVENPTSASNAVFFDVLSGRQDSETPAQTLMLANNHRVFVSQGIASVLTFKDRRRWVSQNLQFGARLHYDRIRRNQPLFGYTMLNETLVSDDQSPDPGSNNKASTLAGALHVIDDLTFFDRWVVSPGLRLELIDSRYTDYLADDPSPQNQFRSVWIPGIGTVFKALPWLSLVGGVHRGFSPVSPGQPAATRPELSINYEMGTRLAHRGLRAEAIGFFNDYSNLSSICTASACGEASLVDQQFNGGKVYIYGLEAAIGYDWRGPWGLELSSNASYTLTTSSFRSSFASENPLFGNVEKGDRVPYVPSHQGALSFGAGKGKWRSDIAATFVGRMLDSAGRDGAPGILRTDRFAVVDLATSYSITSSDHLYLTIDNLLNSTYVASRRPFGPRPGLPISFFVGYKHDFGKR